MAIASDTRNKAVRNGCVYGILLITPSSQIERRLELHVKGSAKHNYGVNGVMVFKQGDNMVRGLEKPVPGNNHCTVCNKGANAALIIKHGSHMERHMRIIVPGIDRTTMCQQNQYPNQIGILGSQVKGCSRVLVSGISERAVFS